MNGRSSLLRRDCMLMNVEAQARMVVGKTAIKADTTAASRHSVICPSLHDQLGDTCPPSSVRGAGRIWRGIWLPKWAAPFTEGRVTTL